MDERSGQFEDKRQLLGLAQRRAFATYLRFGRMPDDSPQPAERKAIDPSASTPAPKTRKATSYYVWRSAGDNRVRATHAARDGRIFAWSDAPQGGHPGTEPNCRCWAEPYYGDPAVPDALQSLTYSYQTDTTGTAPWASIETLTRPDGSVAQSVVISRDGTQFRSQFAGTQVYRQVALATGQTVRIDTSAGVQSIYRGDDQRPLFQSAWTAHGPKIISGRQHIAFLGDLDTLLEPDFDRLDSIRDPLDATFDPHPVAGLLGPHRGGGLGLAALALLALYAMRHAAPASQGLSETDRPVLVSKAWTLGGETGITPVLIDALTEERVRQACKYLPDVQLWTDSAALRLASQRASMTAREWGTKVHLAVKQAVEVVRAASPVAHDILRAEISMTVESDRVSYGTTGSTRLDIFEDRRSDMGAICVYDVKTGTRGVGPKQLKAIAEVIRNNYNGATFYVIEVRPTP